MYNKNRFIDEQRKQSLTYQNISTLRCRTQSGVKIFKLKIFLRNKIAKLYYNFNNFIRIQGFLNLMTLPLKSVQIFLICKSIASTLYVFKSKGSHYIITLNEGFHHQNVWLYFILVKNNYFAEIFFI